MGICHFRKKTLREGMNMPKLLVVDKSVFHSLHSCDEKLFEFVSNYNVVLPDALAAECLISEKQIERNDKDPEKLWRSFDGAIKAGAKMGCSTQKLLQTEKVTLCSVKSIVNETNTELFRNGSLTTKDFKQEAESCRKVIKPIIKTILKFAEIFSKKLIKNPEAMKELSAEDRGWGCR